MYATSKKACLKLSKMFKIAGPRHEPEFFFLMNFRLEGERMVHDTRIPLTAMKTKRHEIQDDTLEEEAEGVSCREK